MIKLNLSKKNIIIAVFVAVTLVALVALYFYLLDSEEKNTTELKDDSDQNTTELNNDSDKNTTELNNDSDQNTTQLNNDSDQKLASTQRCSRGCQRWYDGCNECSCSKEAEILSCTEKYCKTKNKTKCLEYYSTDGFNVLSNSSWALIKVGEIEIDNPFNFTLRFDDQSNVGGKNDCNTYFGKYRVSDDNKIKFYEIGETKAYCDSEANLTQILSTITEYSVTKFFSNDNLSSAELRLKSKNNIYIFSEIIEGTVEYQDLEGGFYGVSSHVNMLFPELLDKFEGKNGHTYEFIGVKESDMMTIYMWGNTLTCSHYQDKGK